jgi:hypothetical protein
MTSTPTSGGYKIFVQRDGSNALAHLETTRVLDDGAEGTSQFMGGTDKRGGVKGRGQWRICAVETTLATGSSVVPTHGKARGRRAGSADARPLRVRADGLRWLLVRGARALLLL